MTTDTQRTSRKKAAEMVAAFDDGMLLDTWLVTHHRDVPRLARDYIALLDEVADRNAELAAALRRIDDAVVRLDALEDSARNVLAAHSTTIDAEYVAVTAGQIEDSLSDWLATVGNDVLARAALASAGDAWREGE